MSTYRGVNARLAWCLNSVINVKAVVAAFNQEKALVGAFSVIVQPVVEPMDRFAALLLTSSLVVYSSLYNSLNAFLLGLPVCQSLDIHS